MKYNGFLERVLFVDGEEIQKPMPKKNYCDESKTTIEGINSSIMNYYASLLQYDKSFSFDVDSDIKTINLSRKATDLWHDERVKLTKTQWENSTNVLGSMCSKKEAKILKFALIINRLDRVCSMDEESNKEVTANQMQRAIKLSDWFFTQEVTQRYKLGHLSRKQTYLKEWQTKVIESLTDSDKTPTEVHEHLSSNGVEINVKTVRNFIQNEEKAGVIKIKSKQGKAFIYGV